MTPVNLFTPKPNKTVVAAVTTSAAPFTVSGGFETLRVANTGSAVAFIEFGGGTASVTSSMPILPNTVEAFSVGGMNGDVSVSLIGAGATTIYLTPGMGM